MTNIDRLRIDFADGKPMASFYPITLDNGSKVCGVNAHCEQCGSKVPDDLYRGSVSTLNCAGIIINNGVAHCQQCVTLFNISMRIKSYKGSFRIEWMENGLWVSHTPKLNTGVIKSFLIEIKRCFPMMLFQR